MSKIIPDIPFKNQAQEDYYYGDNLILENYLETTETKAALVIDEMPNKSWVPSFEDVMNMKDNHFE